MSKISELEKQLWDVADHLRANSGLRSNEYSAPVLGLIFLAYADHKFTEAKKEVEAANTGRKSISKEDYQARGVFYLPEEARFSYLLKLTESQDIGGEINGAMKVIEEENEELKDVLPKNYNILENDTLHTLLKKFSNISMDIDGDVFGKIYEYFLGKFASSEGQKGGEFFTPESLVKLIVEIIEPYKGRILDPACGSGGMFVHSAKFIEKHKKSPSQEIAVYGQEKTLDTVKLCKLNMAVHGLSGDIKQGNTFYQDIHNSVGKFDYVMANPPFNVKGVDKEKIKNDPRYPLGIPRNNNANYLWIQIFLSALKESGRAGFVMSNAAADAGQSEQVIRKELVEKDVVDVMVSVGNNFFYNVSLPCSLWFFDKGKNEKQKGKVLFIDAREIYTPVDRAHSEFTPQQIEYIANIARLHRGEKTENEHNSKELLDKHFKDGMYTDVPGICKVEDKKGIEVQGWSLNPGRYVGIAPKEDDGVPFEKKMKELNSEFDELVNKSRELEEKIKENLRKVT